MVDLDEEEGSGAFKEAGMMEKEPAENFKPRAKAPIVTKEQLEKSGLSLRDYMNKQQGLTRRGESAPVAKTDLSLNSRSEPASENSSVTRMSKEAGEAARAKFRESSKPDETKMSLSERAKMSRERARSGDSKTDTRSVNQRLREAVGFKKGGSVSSASSRGDGIASKGKTRGKIY
jgi:hypothetical protein